MLRVVARHDHCLGVGAMEERQLLARAAPGVAVEGARRLWCVAELTVRVDRVARDHEVALVQTSDHALVARRVPGREGEPNGPVAEQVEGAAEGRVRGDVRALVAERPVVEQEVVVRRPVAAQQRSRVRGRRVPLRRRRSRRSSYRTRTSPRRGPGAGGSSRPGAGPWPRSPAREAGRVCPAPARSAAGRTGPTADPCSRAAPRPRTGEGPCPRASARRRDAESGRRGRGRSTTGSEGCRRPAPSAFPGGPRGARRRCAGSPARRPAGARRSPWLPACRRGAARSAASTGRGPSSVAERTGGQSLSSPGGSLELPDLPAGTA